MGLTESTQQIDNRDSKGQCEGCCDKCLLCKLPRDKMMYCLMTS